MNLTVKPRKITLAEWDRRYAELRAAGLREPSYGGPLRRHLEDGDQCLLRLQMDNSAAALRLWNFLLTEEARLRQARTNGQKIVGTMKDLGTVPVMAYSAPNLTAFYPDGAWWIPCVMQSNSSALAAADALGINESFCPVRAMLGAFADESHFPLPDLLVCSVGATCDDFSAIAQRVDGLGYPVLWWEMPQRRQPEAGELSVALPGGLTAPAEQVAFVRAELNRVRSALESLSGTPLDAKALRVGIRKANGVRQVLAELRRSVFTAPVCPLPALELHIAEMLAIHFCSDRAESAEVLRDLLGVVRERIALRTGVLPGNPVRIYWVNPVADIQVMNLLEDCGGRLCGSDFMFCHALDEIAEDVPPMEALARAALADPMVGPAAQRAERICREALQLGAEAVLVSRISGASHCATEGAIIREWLAERLPVPALEIEVPSVSAPIMPSLKTRLEALVETARERRKYALRGD